MSIIFNARSRSLGYIFHGVGPGGGNVTRTPTSAISTSIALSPSILSPITLTPASAISTSVGVNPSIVVGGVTQTPGSGISTSVAPNPSISTGGSAAIVQSAQIYTGQSLAFPSNNTAGNLLVAFSSWSDPGTNPTISDTQGNSWTAQTAQLVPALNGGADTCQRVYFAPNCAAGANTVNLSTNVNDQSLEIYEVSGIATVSPLEAAVATTAPNTLTTTPTSDTITTSVPCFIMVGYADETSPGPGSFAASTGYTLGEQDLTHYHAQEYDLSVAAGAYTPGFTIGTSGKTWLIYAIAFKLA